MKSIKLIYFPLAIILCALSSYLGERAEIFNKIALGLFITICAFAIYLIINGIINTIKSYKKIK